MNAGHRGIAAVAPNANAADHTVDRGGATEPEDVVHKAASAVCVPFALFRLISIRHTH